MTLPSHTRLFVTGATGQLGGLVIQYLLRTVPAAQVVAGVRDAGSEGARKLAGLGVEVRTADYARPDTLATAFEGIERLLLISSSEVGQRAIQHQNVIAAAKAAGVRLIAYTSLLHADTSPLALAEEHRATEAMLAASGVPHVLLRNGWYTENYAASIPPALAHGVFLGSAGEGRIASAARADYAAAASIVLTAETDQGGRIYELAGDEAYTLSDFAKLISQASGKPVAYQNLPEAEFRAALIGAGLPDAFAGLLADSDAGAEKGALFDDGRQLNALIGRPTTSTSSVIEAALKG
jgi:NAD(P)H dehydrogenase (quinone)